MFVKTARAQIRSVIPGQDEFRVRTAGFVRKARRNMLDNDFMLEISKQYDVSYDPKDYDYVIVRAVTANVPNNNGDCFTSSELLRPHLEAKCRVYRTFCYAPHHVNHRSDNPKDARGFVADAHYNTSEDSNPFVECVVAVDRTKDPSWATAIRSKKIDNFSMGCVAAYTICSLSSCRNKATTTDELCFHVRNQRMEKVAGELVYEECYGVTFRELSGVDRGADRLARTRGLLEPKMSAIGM